jgi:hypothetical protein
MCAPSSNAISSFTSSSERINLETAVEARAAQIHMGFSGRW